jgi:hypothetical protein
MLTLAEHILDSKAGVLRPGFETPG